MAYRPKSISKTRAKKKAPAKRKASGHPLSGVQMSAAEKKAAGRRYKKLPLVTLSTANKKRGKK